MYVYVYVCIDHTCNQHITSQCNSNLGVKPHPKHDFKHETDSMHCVFRDKTVNVCLQSVSETAAITT